MKVVHVLHDLSSQGAGVTEAVRTLTRQLQDHSGCEVTVVGGDPNGVDVDWGTVQVVGLHLGIFGRTGRIGTVLDELNPDLMHVHGTWVGICSEAMSWAKRKKRAYVMAPHGMFDAWALNHSPWKKVLYWNLVERRLLKQAAFFHVLNTHEAEAVCNLLPGARTEVIPNPVALPKIPEGLENVERPVLLFLGRLHPKKSILELVKAWRQLCEAEALDRPWELHIAGEGERDYVTSCKEGAGSLLGTRIQFLGQLGGSEKAQALFGAEASVLPSKSEGLPMSVLEAWAAGLPVAMTEECYLQEGFEVQAAQRISLEQLTDDLTGFCNQIPDVLRQMGANGRHLVEKHFSLEGVCARMIDYYTTLL